jgi:non-specific serine/threonine protein kinase/serine/threonine-protein kinase
MIRRGMDSERVIRRFAHERQILATLDHPSIARLLDGGTTEDGVPYLVMELVEGSRVDAYCEQQDLSIAERLQLFCRICDAVQYAHQHLVIHRDLKPANILVQADGVPKLLDFGIAKLLDDAASHETILGGAMTPAYASPEQVRGEPITTASDVYSLGVILYQLLTGRSPYPADTASALELARRVCETVPVRPSAAVVPSSKNGVDAERARKRRRRLTGDLDAITLTALRKEPQRRYASVEQFALDISRHLRRLPIAASRGSFRYRSGKFIARHRIGVSAAAVAILAILGGAVATAWQARAAQRQAAIAGAERARAERRFNDVRKLANAMIFEVHDSIEDLPGATRARRLIVERALTYLDSLAQESRDDASLQRELADAYRRIGDLQGGPYTANLGDTPAALRSYQRALSIRETLLAAGSTDLADVIGFAEASRATADALQASSNASDALAHTRRAIDALEAARAAHPRDRRLLEELMRAYGAQASLHASVLVNTSLGDIAAALPLRRNQLDIAQRLYDMFPGDQDAMKALASASSDMGDQLLMMGQRKRAAAEYLRAQQHLSSLAGLSRSRSSLFALHDIYYRLVPVHLADGELERARAAAQRAVQIAEGLAADADNAQARLVLAADLANMGETLAMSGRHEEARATLARAMAIDAELVRRFPNTSQFRHIRFQRSMAAGRIYGRAGRYGDALNAYRDAREILRKVLASAPSNRGSALRLAFAEIGIGSILARAHNLTEAAQAYRDALAAASAPGQSSSEEEATYAIATAYAGLGAVQAAEAATSAGRQPKIARLREALASMDRSLEQWQRVSEPGLVSPGGYDCTPPEDGRRQRARIAATLTALGAAD